jgi:hypothetical protein
MKPLRRETWAQKVRYCRRAKGKLRKSIRTELEVLKAELQQLGERIYCMPGLKALPTLLFTCHYAGWSSRSLGREC